MLKFSLVLTLAMMLAILGLGAVLYQRFHGELFEDIKREGAHGVTTLATVGGEVIEGRRRQARFVTDFQTSLGASRVDRIRPETEKEEWRRRVNQKIGEFNQKIEGVNKSIDELAHKMQSLTKEIKAERATQRSALSTILEFLPEGQNAVMHAVITELAADGSEIRVMGAENESMKFYVLPGERPKPLTIISQDREMRVKDVDLNRGYYQLGSDDKIPALKFRKPIISTNGEVIGAAHLTLSAQRVDEISSRMQAYLVVSCAIALVCGLGLSFLLSALVSRPLKHLLDDVRIVAQGQLDHHSAVRTSDEVGVLAHAFNQMTISLQSAHRKEVESEVLRRDMKVAREVQAHLVPQEMPNLPGLDLTAKYEPARDVGGDAFDLIPLPNDRLGVVIADVSGKGVPGALYMAMTRIAFRVATIYAGSPKEVVNMVHQLMAPELTRGRFITAVYMEVDARAGTARCCRLGHDPILKFCAESGEVESYVPRGTAVGILPTEVFRKKVEVSEFSVMPGDRVLLYTDGITEAADPDDEEYGIERIEAFMIEYASLTSDQFVSKLLQDVKIFTQGRDLQDDLTVISLALPIAASASDESTAENDESTAEVNEVPPQEPVKQAAEAD